MLEGTMGERRKRRARFLALASATTLLVGQAGLWLSIEPIATWSYDLSWWSAILLIDAVVCLRTGSSIALARPGAFCALAFWSGTFWLLYECANFRLRNWYYVGIPGDLATRTLGVYISFATVLPGVLEIYSLLSSFTRPRHDLRARSLPGSGARTALAACGAACLILPLAFPDVAYPLIWGAPFLLLEPWLAKRDERSLLARWYAGDRGPIRRLLLAGFVCGAIWETWNWRSPAKWIYTVPLFEEGKLFEMPYLGFVGFVPFALGCHSAARALVVLGWIPEWEGEPSLEHGRQPRGAVLAATMALLFSVVAIAGVNRFTVRATRPWVSDIPGMPAEFALRLAAAGVRHPEDLVRVAHAGYSGVDLDGTSAEQREGWVEIARLMTVRGLGLRGWTWLANVGVLTVDRLASSDARQLQEKMMGTRAPGPPPEPTLAEVRVWVRGAQAGGG